MQYNGLLRRSTAKVELPVGIRLSDTEGIVRTDISDWLIHFVHDRVPENDPHLTFDEGEIRLHTDLGRHRELEDWFQYDREYGLPDNADAFSVLRKILHDGHIRAGWSFRNGRATIYGPRPAVCLTEMPLHGLLAYAAESRQRGNVDCYGIAFLKADIFRGGGRQVIYGLSGQHRENGGNPWPRMLAATCGLAEHEQYRYVATNLGQQRRVDWTHEREWRWADIGDRCSVPGLPVFLAEEPLGVSQALILVQTQGEADALLGVVKTLYDAEYGEYFQHYSRETLANTRIVALDNVIAAVGEENLHSLRIEDIPTPCRLEFARPTPSPALLERVQGVVAAAEQAAQRAAAEWVEIHEHNDVFGFAYVMIADPQSALTSALIQLDLVNINGPIGYSIRPLSMIGTSSMLGEQEAAAEAAIAILRREFPDVTFWTRTVWD